MMTETLFYAHLYDLIMSGEQRPSFSPRHNPKPYSNPNPECCPHHFPKLRLIHIPTAMLSGTSELEMTVEGEPLVNQAVQVASDLKSRADAINALRSAIESRDFGSLVAAMEVVDELQVRACLG